MVPARLAQQSGVLGDRPSFLATLPRQVCPNGQDPGLVRPRQAGPFPSLATVTSLPLLGAFLRGWDLWPLFLWTGQGKRLYGLGLLRRSVFMCP